MSEITILKFSASWCRPCSAFKPIIQQVVEETGVAVVSYDADEHEKKFEEYGIRSVPVLIFLKNELEVGRKTGLIGKADLIGLIEQYKNG